MVRKENQDSYFLDEENGVFIVADGMGGHAGGQVASKMCVEEFKTLTHKVWSDSVETSDVHMLIERTFNKACTKIYEKSLENPDLRGMGTTASAGILIGEKVHFGHVGDSRIYLYRGGFIYQLSHDHSLVAEQLQAGVITEETAQNHQLKNVITRSIGYQEDEYVDTFSILAEAGDTLLLCSDGLVNKVTDSEIAEMIASSHDSEQTCRELVELANSRGGEDNTTVLIANIYNN